MPNICANRFNFPFQRSGRDADGRRSGPRHEHREPCKNRRPESACAVPGMCTPRVGQNRTSAPYMTVYSVISLPKIPYIHRIHMVLANPIYIRCMYGRKFTDYTVIHSVYTRFWPTLTVSRARRAGLDWCVQCQVFL